MMRVPLRIGSVVLTFAILAGCTGTTASKQSQAASGQIKSSAKRASPRVASAAARNNKRAYPPFVNETDAATRETSEVLRDLPTLNNALASGVLTSFTATTAYGLPQFNYIVNQDAWNAVSEARRTAAVSPGGSLFKETERVYRKYHRGRVCLGNPDNNLMLHVINERGVQVGLDYTVFVAHSECPRSALKQV